MDTQRGNPRINELVRPSELQKMVSDLFPSRGSIEWEIRTNRQLYIARGALFEIGGRLLIQPQVFRQVALELGKQRLAERHGVDLADDARRMLTAPTH